jgi:hypothetical protein
MRNSAVCNNGEISPTFASIERSVSTISMLAISMPAMSNTGARAGAAAAFGKSGWLDGSDRKDSMGGTRKDEASADSHIYGRRAAEALDVARALDHTLEMLLSSQTNQIQRDEFTRVRLLALTHKEEFIMQVAEIYASAYSIDELKALVAFLESPAGEAMRKKQPDVESRVRQATMAFLQSL